MEINEIFFFVAIWIFVFGLSRCRYMRLNSICISVSTQVTAFQLVPADNNTRRCFITPYREKLIFRDPAFPLELLLHLSLAGYIGRLEW